MKKMYFKIYQDKKNIDECYVEKKENLESLLEACQTNYQEGSIELFPIIEPVMMTEEEYDILPEFKGF